MAETVKMTLPNGQQTEGIPVAVKESTERWTDIELADGTKVKVKVTVTSAFRAVGAYDHNGLPWYNLNIVHIFAPMEVPENLKEQKVK